MSAFSSKRNDEDNKHYNELLQFKLKNRGIDYKEVLGVYAGVSELSVIFSAEHESEAIKLCQAFDQECYLYLNEDRDATLVYAGGRRENIGRFQAITETIANTLKSFTYCPKLKQHYGVI